MKRVKILYIIDKLHRAGAQVHLSRALQNLDRDRFEVHVVCLMEGGPLAEELKKSGTRVHVLGIQKIYNFKALRKLFVLVRFMKKHRFNIVHNYLFSANIYGTIAAWLAQIPVIITSRRDTGRLREGGRVHILAYRLTNPLVHKVVCVTESVKNIVMRKEKLSQDKVTTIYNGIEPPFRTLTDIEKRELRKQCGIDPSDQVVGFIANFNWIKGHTVFIEAAAQIASALGGQAVKFLLIGDGALKEKIQSQIKASGLEDKVLLLGKRDDIGNLLQIMDVSVNLSYSEGMSNTLLESMAAGVPLIATDVDGNRETVCRYPSEGCTGILVPAKDPEAAAQAMLQLLEDTGLREKMAANGRKRIREHFRSKKMVENMSALYRELVSENRIAFVLSQFPETHETFILREFKGLKEKGLDFEIYSLKPCRDRIVHPEAKEFIKRTVYAPAFCLWSMVYGLWSNPVGFLKAYIFCVLQNLSKPLDFIKVQAVFLRSLYFARIMKKHGIRHIHAHWATMPTTSAQIIFRLLNIPFSFTAHAWDIYLNPKKELKEKIKEAKFVATCTKANKSYLENFNQGSLNGKIIINYHGIDLPAFPFGHPGGVRGQTNIILAIGRLVEQKGFEYLIKACGQLARESVPFRCVIVGDGPLRRHLESVRDNLGLKKVVEMPGTVTQQSIKELFQKACVFVAPSVIASNGDRDGIPNVILEALAMGVPVVATTVSGIPEVVEDQKTGVLVKPRDERLLAEAIKNVLLGQLAVERFKINGRQKIEEEFDLAKNVEQLVRIFNAHGLIPSNTPGVSEANGQKGKYSDGAA